ncbi:MAG: Fic family protein [Flavobacteriales bacterium]|nr:Fic family protein [Flavobacteriales bacterium]
MEIINKAISFKKQLDELRPLSPDDEQRIMQKFRLDWNYHSNHIEGNSLTYGETKALILFGTTAQGKPLKDHFEISGHNEAIDSVYDVIKEERPLTEHFIREMHTILLKKPYEVDAITPDGKPTKKLIQVGKYKETPNHVKTATGEIFRFATPEETPAKMQELLDWYSEKKEEKSIEPIILAAEFHYKFISIHPFDDGNGRLARLMMNFILMKFGYPPTIIHTEDKENYFAVLREADTGTIEPFINYIAKNLLHSLDIMIRGAKGESVEESDDVDKEISLLNQKLQTISKRIDNRRNEGDIKNIYANSFRRVASKYIKACSKFDEFYFSKECHVLVANYGIKLMADMNIDEQLDKMEEHISDETATFKIDYTFKGFRQSGFGEFNERFEFVYSFNLSEYHLGGHGMDSVHHYYNELPTDEEVDNLIKQFKREHMRKINAHIDSYKKKSS